MGARARVSQVSDGDDDAEVQISEKKEVLRTHFSGIIKEGANYASHLVGELYKPQIKKPIWDTLGLYTAVAKEVQKIPRLIIQEMSKWLAIDRTARRSKHALDVMLDYAEQICLGAVDKKDKEILEKYLKEYLENNDIYLRTNLKHPKSEKVVESTKKGFYAQLDAAVKFLDASVSEAKFREIENDSKTLDKNLRKYAEICRAAFPIRHDAEAVLNAEYEIAERILDMAEKEEGLLNVPKSLQPKVFRVSKSTYAWLKDLMREYLNEIYDDRSAWGLATQPVAADARAGR